MELGRTWIGENKYKAKHTLSSKILRNHKLCPGTHQDFAAIRLIT